MSDETPARAPNGGTSLFRREAIEHRAGHRQESDVLRLGRAGVGWLGPVLLVATAAAVLACLHLRLPVRASGPAVVVDERGTNGADARFVLAALPERALRSLRPGDAVRFRADGDPARTATLTLLAVGDAARAPAAERCAIETRAARDGMRGPLVLVRLGAPVDAAGGEGRVSASLGSERLVFALFPDLEKVFPDGIR